MNKLDYIEIGVLALVIGKIFVDVLSATIKSIFQSVIDFFSKKLFASTTLVGTRSEDFYFSLMREWLSFHPYTKKCTSTMIVYSTYQTKYITIPAVGNHFIFFKKTPLLITYTEDDKGNKTYNLSTIWFRKSILDELLVEIKKYHVVDGKKDLTLWVWDDEGWNSVYGKQKRSLSTVYMQDTQKNEILNDLKWFLKSKEFYDLRGIPYNRGYLFYGPPGTGKSSLALALASELDLPVFALNLASVRDSDLQKVLNVQSPCILLIEDVDRCNVARDTGWKDDDGKQIMSLSLSGLLNAIDGVFSRCGRILIMTSNHPEKLDAALIRSGRVDRKFEIGMLDAKQVGKMFKAFYPNFEEFENLMVKTATEYPKPAADWQGMFIKYQENPEELFKFISEDIKKTEKKPKKNGKNGIHKDNNNGLT